MTLTDELTAAIVASIGLGMHRRAAAQAAGVSPAMLKAWEKRAATTKGKAHQLVLAIEQAEAAAAQELHADRTGLSSVEFAVQQLRDVTRLRAKAEAAGSWQAAAILSRQVVAAHLDLTVARKAGDVGLNEMSEEDYQAELRRDVEEWPEEYFGIVFGVYVEKHRVLIEFSPMGGKADIS